MAASLEKIFTFIYNNNLWFSRESASGRGSTLESAQVLIEELPKLLKKYKVEKMLDAACGDFNWMKEVDLGVDYIGIDIVKEIVDANSKEYANEARTFKNLNFIEDELPKVDLILCRDVFIHIPNKTILRALENFKSSGAKYLLTTTYNKINRNFNMFPGGFRKLNLENPPFNLGAPLDVIKEPYDVFFDREKILGLWDLRTMQI